MFKYFKIDSDSDIDSLKKQFKENAKRLHPDFNKGKEQEYTVKFKEMIQEYEQALKHIGEQKNKTYTMDFEYTDLIVELLKMEMVNVDIEICGWFIYVSGNTKPYKNKLGKNGLGLIWNPKKEVWYYKPSWYYRKNKNSWSMEKIRSVYGSERVEQEKQEREKLTA